MLQSNLVYPLCPLEISSSLSSPLLHHLQSMSFSWEQPVCQQSRGRADSLPDTLSGSGKEPHLAWIIWLCNSKLYTWCGANLRRESSKGDLWELTQHLAENTFRLQNYRPRLYSSVMIYKYRCFGTLQHIFEPKCIRPLKQMSRDPGSTCRMLEDMGFSLAGLNLEWL